MKLWSFQSKFVMDKLVEDGIYYPDFKNGSEFAKKTQHAYNLLKNDYIEANNVECKGVVFGVSHYENKPIETFEDYKFAIENSGVGGCSTTDPDNYLLELEVPDNIDPKSLQFYNFSDLIAFLDRDEECTSKELISTIEALYSSDSCVNLVQSHVHYIDKSMIKGIHNVYGGDYLYDYESEDFKFVRREVKPNNIEYYINEIMGGM